MKATAAENVAAMVAATVAAAVAVMMSVWKRSCAPVAVHDESLCCASSRPRKTCVLPHSTKTDASCSMRDPQCAIQT